MKRKSKSKSRAVLSPSKPLGADIHPDGEHTGATSEPKKKKKKKQPTHADDVEMKASSNGASNKISSTSTARTVPAMTLSTASEMLQTAGTRSMAFSWLTSKLTQRKSEFRYDMHGWKLLLSVLEGSHPPFTAIINSSLLVAVKDVAVKHSSNADNLCVLDKVLCCLRSSYGDMYRPVINHFVEFAVPLIEVYQQAKTSGSERLSQTASSLLLHTLLEAVDVFARHANQRSVFETFVDSMLRSLLSLQISREGPLPDTAAKLLEEVVFHENHLTPMDEWLRLTLKERKVSNVAEEKVSADTKSKAAQKSSRRLDIHKRFRTFFRALHPSNGVRDAWYPVLLRGFTEASRMQEDRKNRLEAELGARQKKEAREKGVAERSEFLFFLQLCDVLIGDPSTDDADADAGDVPSGSASATLDNPSIAWRAIAELLHTSHEMKIYTVAGDLGGKAQAQLLERLDSPFKIILSPSQSLGVVAVGDAAHLLRRAVQLDHRLIQQRLCAFWTFVWQSNRTLSSEDADPSAAAEAGKAIALSCEAVVDVYSQLRQFPDVVTAYVQSLALVDHVTQEALPMHVCVPSLDSFIRRLPVLILAPVWESLLKPLGSLIHSKTVFAVKESLVLTLTHFLQHVRVLERNASALMVLCNTTTELLLPWFNTLVLAVTKRKKKDKKRDKDSPDIEASLALLLQLHQSVHVLRNQCAMWLSDPHQLTLADPGHYFHVMNSQLSVEELALSCIEATDTKRRHASTRRSVCLALLQTAVHRASHLYKALRGGDVRQTDSESPVAVELKRLCAFILSALRSDAQESKFDGLQCSHGVPWPSPFRTESSPSVDSSPPCYLADAEAVYLPCPVALQRHSHFRNAVWHLVCSNASLLLPNASSTDLELFCETLVNYTDPLVLCPQDADSFRNAAPTEHTRLSETSMALLRSASLFEIRSLELPFISTLIRCIILCWRHALGSSASALRPLEQGLPSTTSAQCTAALVQHTAVLSRHNQDRASDVEWSVWHVRAKGLLRLLVALPRPFLLQAQRQLVLFAATAGQAPAHFMGPYNDLLGQLAVCVMDDSLMSSLDARVLVKWGLKNPFGTSHDTLPPLEVLGNIIGFGVRTITEQKHDSGASVWGEVVSGIGFHLDTKAIDANSIALLCCFLRETLRFVPQRPASASKHSTATSDQHDDLSREQRSLLWNSSSFVAPAARHVCTQVQMLAQTSSAHTQSSQATLPGLLDALGLLLKWYATMSGKKTKSEVSDLVLRTVCSADLLGFCEDALCQGSSVSPTALFVAVVRLLACLCSCVGHRKLEMSDEVVQRLLRLQYLCMSRCWLGGPMMGSHATLVTESQSQAPAQSTAATVTAISPRQIELSRETGLGWELLVLSTPLAVLEYAISACSSAASTPDPRPLFNAFECLTMTLQHIEAAKRVEVGAKMVTSIITSAASGASHMVQYARGQLSHDATDIKTFHALSRLLVSILSRPHVFPLSSEAVQLLHHCIACYTHALDWSLRGYSRSRVQASRDPRALGWIDPAAPVAASALEDCPMSALERAWLDFISSDRHSVTTTSETNGLDEFRAFAATRGIELTPDTKSVESKTPTQLHSNAPTATEDVFGGKASFMFCYCCEVLLSLVKQRSSSVHKMGHLVIQHCSSLLDSLLVAPSRSDREAPRAMLSAVCADSFARLCQEFGRSVHHKALSKHLLYLVHRYVTLCQRSGPAWAPHLSKKVSRAMHPLLDTLSSHELQHIHANLNDAGKELYKLLRAEYGREYKYSAAAEQEDMNEEA